MTQDRPNQDLLNRAAAWMAARGWKRKLAKERHYQQSLFEHSLNELDALLRLIPILARPEHMHLSADEGRVLQAAVLAHDVGKETDEFQEYVTGRRAHAAHIDAEHTRQAVPQVCEALGFGDIAPDVMAVIENCINVHHPSPASVLEGMLQGVNRWWPLARVVMAVDHVCSAAGLLDARETLERDILGQFLHVSYHQAEVRGVSTTLLHRAAEEAFMAMGWVALLCFANGTLYVADGAVRVSPPTVEDITDRLRQAIDERLAARDLSGIIVGSPTASILPKPELVDFAKVKSCMLVASKRVHRGSFIKKKIDDRRKVVSSYLKLIGRDREPLTDDVIARETARIDAAQPEMVVFKLFKALTTQPIVGKEGAAIAAADYDALFGPGAWEQLQSTSTLMAANDMARTVDRFWALPGTRFGLPATRMEEVEPEERVHRLVQALDEIVSHAQKAGGKPSPIEALAHGMAESFVKDLVSPAAMGDPRAQARAQLAAYARSKATAGKETKEAAYLCPICSRPFGSTDGEMARADFVEKPEAHTNRALAHGSFTRIVICNACRYERMLLQILIGQKPAQMLILLPHMNIGRGAGALLMQKLADWVAAAQAIMAGSSTSGVTLGLTSFIADKLGATPPEALSSDELTRIVTYRVSDDTRKRRLRDLTKALQAKYENDLEQANREWGTSYTSWEGAGRALMDEELTDPEARDLRREVLQQSPSMYLVAETPNLLLMPLTLPIAADRTESSANRAFRELFVLLLVGMAFDVAVLTLNEGEAVEWTGGEGVARVPAVPAVRSLIGDEWVQLADAPRWLRIIGAAARLGYPCGFSPRSDILRVLTESPPERLLVRIEQADTGIRPGMEHIQLIDTIKGVRA